MPQKYLCPICSEELEENSRYPNYVCDMCVRKSVSIDNRVLIFNNVNFSGGYSFYYEDSGEEYNSHECFINGTLCYADEARFGGIVVQVVLKKNH